MCQAPHISVLYKTPRVLPDSRYVKNRHIVGPLESTKVKVDCSPESGVRWSPPDSAGLDSSRVKMGVESREGGPVDCAGLDSSRVKNGSGVHRSPPDCTI
jgi:hypothetical protein